MSLIVLYFLQSTSVHSFYIDVVLTLSIWQFSVTYTQCHLAPLPTPEQKLCTCSYAQNWNDQPAIRGCAILFTVTMWFAVTSCGLSIWISSAMWFIILNSPLLSDDTIPRLCCDPQFSWTCQHQCDVHNRKSCMTSNFTQVCMGVSVNSWLST